MPKVVQLRSCGEKPLKKQKSLKWAFFGAFSRIQVVLYLNQLVSQRSKSRNEHTKGSDGLDLQENDKANSANKKTLNHTQSNCMLIRRSECTCSFLFRMAACWSAFPLQTGGHNLAQTNARVLRDLRECQTQPIDMRPTYIRDSASPVKFSGVLGLRLMKKVFSISSNQKNNLCATAKVLELTGLTKLFLGGLIAAHFIFARSIIATTFCATGERIILAIGTATAEIYTAFGRARYLVPFRCDRLVFRSPGNRLFFTTPEAGTTVTATRGAGEGERKPRFNMSLETRWDIYMLNTSAR